MAALVYEGYRHLRSSADIPGSAALLAYQRGLEMVMNGCRPQEPICDAL